MPEISAPVHGVTQPIDTSRPAAPRVYNALLGGKDNYPVDRAAADEATRRMPHLPLTARANLAWTQRAVRYLITELGISQFIDIGPGIPVPGNSLDVAHALNRSARMVYVDCDPIVLAHAGALLASYDRAHVAVVAGDLRHPAAIFRQQGLRHMLDPDRPTGVIMAAVLHFLSDAQNPGARVAEVMAELAPGSAAAISHICLDQDGEALNAALDAFAGIPERGPARTSDQIRALFGDLVLVDPGVVAEPWWRPDIPILTAPQYDAPPLDEDGAPLGPVAVAAQNWLYGGVGVKR